MADPRILSIEKLLAYGHRSLIRAAYEAESLRDQGLSEDLHNLAAEVAYLGEQLLKSRPSRSHPRSSVRI